MNYSIHANLSEEITMNRSLHKYSQSIDSSLIKYKFETRDYVTQAFNLLVFFIGLVIFNLRSISRLVCDSLMN